MHILIVDDGPEIRKLYVVNFNVQGHQTEIARNGTEALKAVQEIAFDAIVMDVEMPGMDGIEAISRIRQLPNGQRVPIVVWTGYSNKPYWEPALAAGANEVVYKPIAPGELLACIGRLCEAEG